MPFDAATSTGPLVPGGVRVLVVDDDPVVCRQTAAGLERAGFQVVTADDGALAMVQAGATPPDLAIVDLEMPTSGLDVVRHLKVLFGSAVHVIVLTGHDDEATRAKAFDAGTDDFVVKPAPLSELRRRLIAAARNQQAFVDSRLAREQADRRIAYGAEASALLAHDLNNGLAVALSNLKYLVDVFGEPSDGIVPTVGPDEIDAIASTLRSLRKMSGLVANFVDIGRFEDAAVKPLREVTSLEALARSVIDVHAQSIPKGVVCDINVVPADLRGNFDSALIERVLHNLIGNAVRYCRAPGWIRLAARRWREEDDGSVELTVQNNGPDIPLEIGKTLFDKYVTGRGGKRGMGLYFCRLACEAHGGSVEHSPTPGGPSFVIRLPGRA
jgi:signal transduction histidine kinase